MFKFKATSESDTFEMFFVTDDDTWVYLGVVSFADGALSGNFLKVLNGSSVKLLETHA
jgi:hypothetical protein